MNRRAPWRLGATGEPRLAESRQSAGAPARSTRPTEYETPALPPSIRSHSGFRYSRDARNTSSTVMESMHSHPAAAGARHLPQSSGFPTGLKTVFFSVYGPHLVALSGVTWG